MIAPRAVSTWNVGSFSYYNVNYISQLISRSEFRKWPNDFSMESESDADPSLLELIYVALLVEDVEDVNMERSSGDQLDEDHFLENEPRIQFVYKAWVHAKKTPSKLLIEQHIDHRGSANEKAISQATKAGADDFISSVLGSKANTASIPTPPMPPPVGPSFAAPPKPSYSRFTIERRQEAIELKAKFVHETVGDFAQKHNLDPSEVASYILNPNLQQGKLNLWKAFQFLRGMAQNPKRK